MRKSCKGFGVRGGGLAEGRGGCSARSTAAQSSRTPAQPITLRNYPTWPASTSINKRLRRKQPSSCRFECEKQSGVGRDRVGRVRRGLGGCVRRRRTVLHAAVPLQPSPKHLSDLWNQFFRQPISLQQPNLHKSGAGPSKAAAGNARGGGYARTGVGVGRGSPVQQAVAECDQPSRLARQRSDVLERLRCPCANAGQINVEAEI